MTVSGAYSHNQKNMIKKIWDFDQKENNQLAYICGRVFEVDDDDTGMWIDMYVEFKDWQNMQAVDNYFPEDDYEVTCATKRPEVEATKTVIHDVPLGRWIQFGTRLDMA